MSNSRLRRSTKQRTGTSATDELLSIYSSGNFAEQVEAFEQRLRDGVAAEPGIEPEDVQGTVKWTFHRAVGKLLYQRMLDEALEDAVAGELHIDQARFTRIGQGMRRRSRDGTLSYRFRSLNEVFNHPLNGKSLLPKTYGDQREGNCLQIMAGRGQRAAISLNDDGPFFELVGRTLQHLGYKNVTDKLVLDWLDDFVLQQVDNPILAFISYGERYVENWKPPSPLDASEPSQFLDFHRRALMLLPAAMDIGTTYPLAVLLGRIGADNSVARGWRKGKPSLKTGIEILERDDPRLRGQLHPLDPPTGPVARVAGLYMALPHPYMCPARTLPGDDLSISALATYATLLCVSEEVRPRVAPFEGGFSTVDLSSNRLKIEGAKSGQIPDSPTRTHFPSVGERLALHRPHGSGDEKRFLSSLPIGRSRSLGLI